MENDRRRSRLSMRNRAAGRSGNTRFFLAVPTPGWQRQRVVATEELPPAPQTDAETVALLADIDAAIAAGDSADAAYLAAQLPPNAYLKAMERAFETSKRNPAPPPRKEMESMKNQFELTDNKAKLSSYTPRRELHGEDPKPAATLKFDIALGADMLAMFSPTLRHSLYEHREGVVRNLADAASTANDLRHPEIAKPLAWTLEMVGAELTIDYGLGGKSNIVLPECTVDDFTIAPQQGAVALIGFRVACHPDEKQSGKLAMMIGKDDLKISLTPPKPEEDLAGEVPPKGSSRRTTAVDAQIAGA